MGFVYLKYKNAMPAKIAIITNGKNQWREIICPKIMGLNSLLIISFFSCPIAIYIRKNMKNKVKLVDIKLIHGATSVKIPLATRGL